MSIIVIILERKTNPTPAKIIKQFYLRNENNLELIRGIDKKNPSNIYISIHDDLTTNLSCH